MSRLATLSLVSLFAVVSFLSAAPLGAQETKNEVALFDLPEHLIAFHRSAPFDTALPLFASTQPPELAELEDGDIGRERILDLIRENVAPQSWDENDAEICLRSGKLMVVHRPEIIAQIQPLLTKIEKQLAQNCRVQIYRLDASDARGRLSKAETDAALKGEVSLVSDLSILSGHMSEFGAGKRIPFVSTYYVEVAEEATISDPVVSKVKVGLFGSVQARIAPSGGIFVRIGLRDADMAHMKNVEVASLGASTLQSPTVDSDTFISSAVLQSGASFVVEAQHGSRDSKFLVRAWGINSPLGAGDKFAFLPMGGFGFPLGGYSMLHLAGNAQQQMPPLFNSVEPEAILEQDVLIDTLMRSSDQNWNDNEYNRLDIVGNSLYIRHGGEKLAIAAKKLAELHRKAIKNVDIELRLVDIDGKSELDPAEIAKLECGKFALSSVTGDRVRATFGRENLAIRDYDVEIAKKATNLAALIQSNYDGCALELRCVGLTQDRVSVSGEFVVRRLAAGNRQRNFEVGGKDWKKTATVDTTTTRRSGFNLNGSYELGAWQLVGVQGGQALLIRLRG